jgi:hypothetical protein
MTKMSVALAAAVARAGVAALACAALATGCSDSGPAGEQATTGGWVQPMTPWGEPDLRGKWPIYHLIGTPFERAEEYGERRTMTPEELGRLEAQVNERNTRYEEEIDSNKMGGGHWAEATEALGLTSLIVDPPNGRLPELTEAGKASAAQMGSGWSNTVFDSVDDFDSWDRCITRGLPVSMLPRNYNNGIQIVQSPGFVVITLEMVHESRVIPTDGRAPLDPAIEQWLGESRGHWEGATLVVETTNFNGKAAMVIAGIPGGQRSNTPTTPDMKITERFTRVNDERIDYEMTVEDPEVLTDQWTVSYPMFLDPKYRFFEYACNEDNTAVRNFIVTSRYERGLAPNGQPRR